MALRLVVALAVFLSGCASRPPVPIPPSRRTFTTAPASLTTMVRLACDGKVTGWGTPISPTSLVTAHHVVDGCASVQWGHPPTATGYLIVTAFKSCDWQDQLAEKNRDCDWAILVTPENGPRFERWAVVTRAVPQNGETVWWKLLLPGGVAETVSGPFIGLDAWRHVHVNGTAWPGSSGSGLFNGDGELVGVVSGHYGPTPLNRTVWGTHMAGILR